MATESEIKQMKRGELNEYAATLGINPDEYKRADDLKSAIFKAVADAESNKTSEDEDDKPKSKAKAAKQDEESAKGKDKKPKVKANPPKPRYLRSSKRYQAARDKVEQGKQYPIEEAIKLAQDSSTVKFDATVELHINLGVDPKQSDELVRGQVILPHGSGKTQKVAAIVPDSEVDKVKKAGADLAGYEDLLAKISKGKVDFDILVAHPDVMKDLSKQAKVLGPQGLMPSPKAGTVTTDVAKVVKELKAGRVEYRVDQYGIIHQAVGKVSYKPEQLKDNLDTLLQAIKAAKPGSSKGVYMQKAVLTTSMGPSIRLDISSI